MRFKIFGGSDCSDMFLAQFVPVVGMSPSELQELANKVVALAVSDTPSSTRDQLLGNDGAAPGSLSPSDLSAACCAVHTVLCNICIYDVDSQQAARELVILGLAQGAADVLVQAAATHRRDIFASMAASVRMAPTVARMHVRKAAAVGAGAKDEEDEADDEMLVSDEFVVSIDKRGSGGAEMTAASGQQVVTFSASGSALRSLLAELITARQAMTQG